MKKTLTRTLLVIGGLILTILIAAQIMLGGGYATRMVRAVASDYVDGDVRIGSVKISVFRNFPNVRIEVSDAAVTYPHERFAAYDSCGVSAVLLDAGRGQTADTLAAFDRMSGAVNVMALLRGKYRIRDAELEGFKAFAHSYDSTAANWDIIHLPESSGDESETPMDIRFGSLRIGGWPEITYTSQQDTVFARAAFKRLAGKGSLSQERRRRRGTDRIGLRLDSLTVSGRLPADTLVALVNSLDVYEHKDHIDIEASAGLRLFTWAFGRMDIPVVFGLEVGLPRPVDGVRLLDVKELRADIAHIPLTAAGRLELSEKGIRVLGDAAVEGCRAGDLIDIYGSQIIPTLRDFSTDAVLDVRAHADGWAGGESGMLPPMTLSMKVEDSHFSYAGVFDGGNFDFSLKLENTDSGVINADVEDFCFKIPGADMNLKGSVKDVTGGDPLISVEATACTEFAELVKYLPETLGLNAAGDVDFELSGSARLSQLNLKGIEHSDIHGRIFSDALSFSSPADSLYAYASRPEVTISTRHAGTADGMKIAAAIDSVRMTSGALIYIMGQDMKLSAGSASKTVGLDVGSLNMRGSDSLTIGVRDSRNTFKMSQRGPQQSLSLGSENKMLYLRSGSHRVALQSVDLSAGAMKRSARDRYRGERQLERLPRVSPDSSRRRVRLPGDSAHVRIEKSLPDYLSEVDFMKHDISLDLGEGIVSLLRQWRPNGSIGIQYGTVTTPMLPLRNTISGVNGSFTDNDITLSSLSVSAGESSLNARGSVSGLRGLLMGRRNAPLRLDMVMNSKMLNANELLAAYSVGAQLQSAEMDAMDDASYTESLAIDTLRTAEVSAENRLLVLPGNISADVDLNVDSLRYSNISLKDFTTCIQMQERCLQLTNTFAEANFGRASVEGFYSTRTKKDISAGFNLTFDGITSGKVVEIFPAVDSLVPMLKSLKGELDCEMAATTQLDTNMNILIPSINGIVKINGTGLELEDTGELRKLAQILMFKDTRVGHINDISVSGVISDNQLEIFPFIMSVDRYTLALKGLQRFDQNFKYHISVIKSPLPFKFGVNLKGNFDNWRYSIGKAQYKSTSIPVFSSAVDTMQVNLIVSIRDIFRKGVDAAIREAGHERQHMEQMKSQMGYRDEDDDDELLSAEEQDELDSYLISMELEQESRKIEEELEKMLEQELMQNITVLTEDLENRKK